MLDRLLAVVVVGIPLRNAAMALAQFIGAGFRRGARDQELAKQVVESKPGAVEVGPTEEQAGTLDLGQSFGPIGRIADVLDEPRAELVRHAELPRSDEHTSEIQSLKRIS